jgi:hypothetical protein
MVDKNTYRIFRHNATFNAPEFVAADGHSYTLHLDKAASFPTLDAAATTQRIHFPNHLVTAATGLRLVDTIYPKGI